MNLEDHAFNAAPPGQHERVSCVTLSMAEAAIQAAVAGEREACAQRCETERDGYQAPRNGWDISDLTQREYFGYQEGCYDCAQAIRARGAAHDCR